VLKQAGQFLSSVRCVLHYRTQSDRNLLDFDAQENISGQAFARGRTRRNG